MALKMLLFWGVCCLAVHSSLAGKNETAKKDKRSLIGIDAEVPTVLATSSINGLQNPELGLSAAGTRGSFAPPPRRRTSTKGKVKTVEITVKIPEVDYVIEDPEHEQPEPNRFSPDGRTRQQTPDLSSLRNGDPFSGSLGDLRSLGLDSSSLPGSQNGAFPSNAGRSQNSGAPASYSPSSSNVLGNSFSGSLGDLRNLGLDASATGQFSSAGGQFPRNQNPTSRSQSSFNEQYSAAQGYDFRSSGSETARSSSPPFSSAQEYDFRTSGFETAQSGGAAQGNSFSSSGFQTSGRTSPTGFRNQEVDGSSRSFGLRESQSFDSRSVSSSGGPPRSGNEQRNFNPAHFDGSQALDLRNLGLESSTSQSREGPNTQDSSFFQRQSPSRGNSESEAQSIYYERLIASGKSDQSQRSSLPDLSSRGSPAIGSSTLNAFASQFRNFETQSPVGPTSNQRTFEQQSDPTSLSPRTVPPPFPTNNIQIPLNNQRTSPTSFSTFTTDVDLNEFYKTASQLGIRQNNEPGRNSPSPSSLPFPGLRQSAQQFPLERPTSSPIRENSEVSYSELLRSSGSFPLENHQSGRNSPSPSSLPFPGLRQFAQQFPLERPTSAPIRENPQVPFSELLRSSGSLLLENNQSGRNSPSTSSLPFPGLRQSAQQFPLERPTSSPIRENPQVQFSELLRSSGSLPSENNQSGRNSPLTTSLPLPGLRQSAEPFPFERPTSALFGENPLLPQGRSILFTPQSELTLFTGRSGFPSEKAPLFTPSALRKDQSGPSDLTNPSLDLNRLPTGPNSRTSTPLGPGLIAPPSPTPVDFLSPQSTLRTAPGPASSVLPTEQPLPLPRAGNIPFPFQPTQSPKGNTPIGQPSPTPVDLLSPQSTLRTSLGPASSALPTGQPLPLPRAGNIPFPFQQTQSPNGNTPIGLPAPASRNLNPVPYNEFNLNPKLDFALKNQLAYNIFPESQRAFIPPNLQVSTSLFPGPTGTALPIQRELSTQGQLRPPSNIDTAGLKQSTNPANPPKDL